VTCDCSRIGKKGQAEKRGCFPYKEGKPLKQAGEVGSSLVEEVATPGQEATDPLGILRDRCRCAYCDSVL
jgi:hypothetical protein